MVKCLLENMAQPNFGEECKEELEKREEGMKSDYRFDIAVAQGCSDDIESYCKEAKTKVRGKAAVLICLVDNFKVLAEQCQSEMSRAVRIALWDYTPGAALTGMCDNDVNALCPKVGARGAAVRVARLCGCRYCSARLWTHARGARTHVRHAGTYTGYLHAEHVGTSLMDWAGAAHAPTLAIDLSMSMDRCSIADRHCGSVRTAVAAREHCWPRALLRA